MARSSGTGAQPLVKQQTDSIKRLNRFLKSAFGDNVPPTWQNYSNKVRITKRLFEKIQRKIEHIKNQNKICLGKFTKHTMTHHNLRCYCINCGFCPLGVMEPKA